MTESVYHQRTYRTQQIAPHHRQMLEESGIAPEIAAERGYYTVFKRDEIPEGFSKNQRRAPALVIPVYSPSGETFCRVRPDRPRPDYRREGRVIKYEQPKGRGIVLDVHPSNMERIKDAGADLWVTEGERKADAIASRKQCAVALFGVYCWGKGGELLPDWDHIALRGRRIYIVFDSDVMTKPEVQKALEGLSGALEARGAAVWVVYLPDTEDGSSQGVDDYLATGGTIEDLYRLARPFDRSDYTRVRLSRNELLRLAIETAWANHDAMPTKTLTECVRRAVYRQHLATAARHGKVSRRGSVSYYLPSIEGAIGANVSQPTFSRHTWALKEDRLLLIEEAADPSHANRYALLPTEVSPGNNNRGGGQRRRSRSLRGEKDSASPVSSRRYSQSSPPQEEIPEFRNSRVIVSWRVDELGRRICEIDPLTRLNPKRREIIVHLLAHGPMSKAEILKRFASGKTTWKYFRRDILRPMINDFPILAIEGDTVHLRDDWREGLEKAREIGQEPEDQRKQLVTYEIKRAAFRNRDKIKPDRHRANLGADGYIEDLELVEDPASALVDQKSALSPLAVAVRDYLERNPHDDPRLRSEEDRREQLSWLASTLWCLGLYPGKPAPDEVHAALEKLGKHCFKREVTVVRAKVAV